MYARWLLYLITGTYSKTPIRFVYRMSVYTYYNTKTGDLGIIFFPGFIKAQC